MPIIFTCILALFAIVLKYHNWGLFMFCLYYIDHLKRKWDRVGQCLFNTAMTISKVVQKEAWLTTMSRSSLRICTTYKFVFLMKLNYPKLIPRFTTILNTKLCKYILHKLSKFLSIVVPLATKFTSCCK